MNKQEYTITVYTENQIGLLNRIAIIFSRRKINVESLNTSPSEIESVHRFTIVINEVEDVVRKLCRQIEKQVEVLKAYYNTNEEIIWQELALYKVPTEIIAEEVKVERLLSQFGCGSISSIIYKPPLFSIAIVSSNRSYLPGIASAKMKSNFSPLYSLIQS